MKNRIIEYDIVRFLAITLVFTLHFTSSAIRNLDLILDFDQSYIKYFGFGVKLFFTLSAFLMSYKLDSLDVKPNKYLIRRIKRILPTHVLIFTILFLLAISLRSSPEIIRFISGVFLVDQVFFTDFNIINPIIWSLEVELQFYFIIYVLLLIRKKLGIIIKPFAIGVFMLIIFLFFSDLKIEFKSSYDISSDSLFVDDIFDSGKTFNDIFLHVDDGSKFIFATLYARRGMTYPEQLIYGEKTFDDSYVVFPWDKLEFKNSIK